MNNHKKFNNKNTLLEANPRLKPGVLRSSQLACFWNSKFRTKAKKFQWEFWCARNIAFLSVRGFKPSEISYNSSILSKSVFKKPLISWCVYLGL